MDRPFAVYKNADDYYVWYSHDHEKGELVKKEGRWFDDIDRRSVLHDFTEEHQENLKKGYQQVVAWYRPSTGETIPHC